MRTIQVTGGFSGPAVLDLADDLAQLTGATFKAALVAEGTAQAPASNAAAWSTPTSSGLTDAAVVLTRLVDNTTSPGHYNVAVDVIAGGRHEVVWAMDADNPDQRALLKVL